jgi:uncharacterized protein (TIGR00255 family)
MRSMTGFGRAQVQRAALQVVAEVRALNQRFLELKLNLPRGWGEHEAELRRMAQAGVSRGRVEIFIRCASLRPPPTRLEVNDQLAKRYVQELRRLGKELGLNGRIGIEAVLQRPEIFHVVEQESDGRQGIELARQALARALKALDVERLREGKSLRRDFAARIDRIAKALPRIEQIAEHTRREVLQNFQSRVRDLLEKLPLDEKRLYEEASNAAQHADITEELTRLRTHLQALKGLLGRRVPVGKPIEFLLQEVNREVNTIGAKSQNATLSQIAVEMKGEVEKMREQVQNVE